MKSSSRNGARVIWLCLHTTEGIMRARDLRAWTSWPGSSHAANDETGVLMEPDDGFVPYDRAAWTLRNGNPISENLEQCGWARWTRQQWLDRPMLLETTAQWLAKRSKARGIPLRRLTLAEVRAKVPGVLMHDDYSKATGDGSHWDCGPGYPWDIVLTRARQIAGEAIPGVSALRFPVVGAIAGAYHKVVLGNARWSFFLGQPKGPEAKTADGTGRWQEFDKGTIYWHPIHTGGAGFVVMGAILTTWRALGNEGVTGYPIHDEMATPDTVGRFSRFSKGWMIYWSPTTGAWPIHGAFLGEWAAQGYERGLLGYPTSGEVTDPSTGLLAQSFQRGVLILDDSGRVQTVRR